MTISHTLKSAVIKLAATGIDSPHLEAEILLSHILKKPREYLLAHGEKKLTAPRISNFKLLISRRLKGAPIAYLTGHKEFYGLDFKVNKNALIPRPETELMVEEALKLATRNSQPVTLIDVGTGSGCIIITLAKLLESGIMNHELWGIDISKKALAVAKRNSLFHKANKNIKFIQGDLLSPLIHNSLFIIQGPFVILCNLPYLTPTQIKNSPSIKREPRSALDGGPDGLKYYRRLFEQIKKGRVAGYALCEIDQRQTSSMKQLVKNLLPGAELVIKKDLCGLNRLAVIKIS